MADARPPPGGAARVSVVIPSYDRGAYLPAAIESVLAQTLPPLEVLVVDDGSTDGSLAIARGYGEPVRVVTQPNRGVSAARNRGIEMTAGEWIAFLDADDVWEPTKLQRQMAAVDAAVAGDEVGVATVGDEFSGRDDPVDGGARDAGASGGGTTGDGPEPVVCAFTDFYRLGGPRDGSVVRRPDHPSAPDWRVRMLCEYALLPSTAVVRARALEGLRFPVGVTDSEDMIFFVELRERGRFVRVGEPLIGYRILESSAVRRAGHELRSVRARFDYLRKRADRYTDEERLAIRRHLAGALVRGHGRALWQDRDPEMVRAYRRLFEEVRPPDLEPPDAFRRRLYPRWMYRVRDAVDALTGL